MASVLHFIVHLPVLIISIICWLLDILTFGIFFRKAFATWWLKGVGEVDDEGNVTLYNQNEDDES
jgi:hypothetical protein